MKQHIHFSNKNHLHYQNYSKPVMKCWRHRFQNDFLSDDKTTFQFTLFELFKRDLKPLFVMEALRFFLLGISRHFLESWMVLKANWSGLVDRILGFFPPSKEEERLFHSVWFLCQEENSRVARIRLFRDLLQLSLSSLLSLSMTVMMMEGLIINIMSEEEG